jgi:YkoY family integral membrane protein
MESALLIILNLVLIESLLSVDNAAVLATMVLDLPKKDRNKALRYGIIGAYVFRGICLLLAAWLVKIWWLKPLGGLYLLYLAYGYFTKTNEGEESVDKNGNWFYRNTVGKVGIFWATVILVEIMDLAFSIDNVFAAVAFTNNIWLIYIGVGIGILAMRFVAQGFVKLMEVYPFLETVAFVVIGLLGVKLLASLYVHFYPEESLSNFLESERADIYTSVLTVLLFIVPVLITFLRRKITK